MTTVFLQTQEGSTPDFVFGRAPYLNRPATVRVEDGRLYWRWHPPTTVMPGPESTVTSGLAEPRPALLAEFCSLRDAEDSLIADFAARWGVLEICKPHGLPVHHHSQQRRAAVFGVRRDKACTPQQHPDRATGYIELSEPLERWRQLSGSALALLKIVEALDQEARVPPDQWQSLYEQRHGRPTLPAGASNDWILIGEWLRERMEIADVRPLLTVFDRADESRFHREIAIGGPGLYGAVVTQLFMAAAGWDRLSSCSCGRLFKRSRRDQQYCDVCREGGVPARLRAQRWRDRRVKGGRLA